MNAINPLIQTAKAFAPATCANVAVGFDILGFALEAVGDQVTLVKREDQQIIVESINSQDALPQAVHQNTASVAIDALCRHLKLEIGFSIHIQKGIPLCSGMGGSAASAVAALVACNQFLASPLTLNELAYFALFGEKAASGEAHYDNIIPCLYGGLTLIQSQEPLNIIKLPIPPLYCVLLHPHLQVSTREARKILKPTVTLADHVQQSAKLASFIAALYENNQCLIQDSLHDLIVEPQRAKFLPGFYEIKNAALEAGALAMSFSGSGPALFAFASTLKEAERIHQAMRLPLDKRGIKSECWLTAIAKQAAFIQQVN